MDWTQRRTRTATRHPRMMVARLRAAPTAAMLCLFVLTTGCATPSARVVFGSCMHQDRDQTAWTAMAEHSPDIVLLAGDNVYGDTKGGVDLTPLRLAYRTLGRSESFRKLQRQVEILPTWDDHDYGDNDAGGDFPGRDAAKRLFLDFWEVPKADPRRHREGVYFKRMWSLRGKRVQVIVLDTRSFRSALTRSTNPKPGQERYIPDGSASKTMLGDAQWAWLEAALRDPADLRLIVSSIQVLADDHGYECWRNLPRERERLVSRLMAEHVGPVVIVSGDRHMGALYRYAHRGRVLVEATSSALNMRITDDIQPRIGTHQLGPWIRDENFGAIELDWERGQAQVSLHRVADGRAVQKLNVGLRR